MSNEYSHLSTVQWLQIQIQSVKQNGKDMRRPDDGRVEGRRELLETGDET